LNTLHLDYCMDFQLSILVHCNVLSPSSSINVYVLFICICYKYFLHLSTKLYSFVMEFIIGMLWLQPLKHHQSSNTTRNHPFSKAQLDQNVHIDQRVCPFWLKVWGMKNTCYIWLIHLTKMTIKTKCQAKDLIKMDKCPSKWPWLNQIGHIELILFSQIEHPNLTLSLIDQ
jgi:hypothetical protein